MKEIIAIIRPNKMTSTKKALDDMGFPAMTAVAVLGRGKQRGLSREVRIDFSPELLARERSSGMKYIPKRMITMVVNDDDVDRIVKTILEVNQTAQLGDGRIFICSMEKVIRIRTDEEDAAAIG